MLTRLIKSTWPAPARWNVVAYAQSMLELGYIKLQVAEIVALSDAQYRLFHTTHLLMTESAREVWAATAHAGLDQDTWKLLIRGGVCARLVSAPGESPAIKIINAMRGERKVWPDKRKQILWEQLSYPAGLADATLVLIDQLDSHAAEYGLEGYSAVLRSVLPSLRRCKKANQERRSAR